MGERIFPEVLFTSKLLGQMNGCLIVKMEFENGFDLLQHVGDLDKSTSAKINYGQKLLLGKQ